MPLVTEYNYEIANSSGAEAIAHIGGHQVKVAAGATVNFRSTIKTDGIAPDNVAITRTVIGYRHLPDGGQRYASEVVAQGDGSKTAFKVKLANGPVDRGSLSVSTTVSASAAERGDDLNDDKASDGRGRIKGSGVDDANSYIDYLRGEIDVVFGSPPDNGTDVTVSYTVGTGERRIDDSDY